MEVTHDRIALEDAHAFCVDVLVAVVEHRCLQTSPKGLACAPGVRTLLFDALRMCFSLERALEVAELEA